MKNNSTAGFTVPELIVTMITFVIISGGVFTLLNAYIASSVDAHVRAAALGAATEQMEYLRSLPYDSLAVQGGTIITSGTPIPQSKEVKRSSRNYVVKTDIRYVDDAYDGCLTYAANQAYLCRNGPALASLPVDSNPRDYKIGEVKVYDKNTNRQYAQLSSQFTSRVAETAGNSSAISVSVFDSAGNPVNSATVRVINTTTTPTIDQTITTDDNGVALFLDIVPDSNADYVITASKAGFSSLSTIAANGTLVPTHPNINAIVQQVSSSSLKIDPISSTSLQATMRTTAGAVVSGASFTIKGGTKLYTDPADTSYSYNQTVTTDGAGVVNLGSLTPGDYLVCYATDSACGSGGRYLAVVQSAYGSATTQSFLVPPGTMSESGSGPMQVIELIVTTSSSFPRIKTVEPGSSPSVSSPDPVPVTITGANLSGATVELRQGATVIVGIVSGTDSSSSIVREFSLNGAATGPYEVVVTTGAGTVIQTGISPGTHGGVDAIP